METILFGISIFLVLATVLPLIPRDDWWIRGFDFPRLQIIILSLIAIGGYQFLLPDFDSTSYIILSLLVISMLYQGYMVYPYTILARPQVEPHDRFNGSNITLMCSNLQMTNRNSSKIKELVKTYDPDIFLAIETDEWWLGELEEFEATYPNTVKQPQDNKYGMTLYSKLELRDTQINFLVEDDIPSIKTRIILPMDKEIILYGLHPRPPFISGSDTSTERDAELLIVGQEIKDMDKPVIVMGDMNDVAWSRTNNLFQKVSGLIDPRIGRGFYNTFHAQYPFIRFSLDHLFHSNDFRLGSFEILPDIGSDHFPVFITLSHELDADIEQEEPEPTENEEEIAENKIKKGT